MLLVSKPVSESVSEPVLESVSESVSAWMSRSVSVSGRVGAVSEPVCVWVSESEKATQPPAIMPSVLTTRPWPIRQKADWH